LDLRGKKWQEAGEDCIMSFISALPGIRVIKSRRMRWMGHVACMREINTYEISVRKLGGKTTWKT
jgi:hypothetical protein